MIYLLFGEDSLQKDKRVSFLKKETLGSSDASLLDFTVLHAQKLTAEDLKKALIALPALLTTLARPKFGKPLQVLIGIITIGPTAKLLLSTPLR